MDFELKLAAAFLGGLLTSFTPCVYPLIPVTLGIMGVRREAGGKRQVFVFPLLFLLGLAAVYSILGFLAAGSGRLLGSLTQTPFFTLAVALVFFGMGLSMLGFFDFALPVRFQTWLAKRGGPGYGGTFVLGAASGLLAAPCSGPVVVGILAYVAQKSNPIFGFLLLVVFSLGLGTPFFFLGVFSRYVARLPKSGLWTEWVKRFAGVALIAAALFYFSNAGMFRPFTRLFSKPRTPQIAWITSEAKGLELASSTRKPAVIDFWASWCSACDDLDFETYSNPRVEAVLKRDFIPIKVDATRTSKEVSELMRKYRVLGLPTILFTDADGKVIRGLTVNGFVDPDRFLGVLEEVRKRLDEGAVCRSC